MAVHDGLNIAVVIVLHLVADTRAAGFRRDGPDTDTPDNDPPDPDDPTVTVTATATATPTSSVVAATSGTSSDNSTLSSGASSSNGVELDQGVKAGIAIGVIVGVFFIAGVIFMIVRRWLRNRRTNKLSPDDPNNPHLAARNVLPSGGGGGTGSEKRSVITTSSADGGANRPWFDTGMGSTELEAGRGGPPTLGPSSWAHEKAELPTPRRGMTPELPDARGTWFEPVELPAAMPFMPPDPNQGEAVDRMGMVGVWRRGSQSTWATGTTSSHNTGTYVSSPTGTTTTGEVFQGTISPCSTGSDGNNVGKASSLVEAPNSVLPRNKD